MKIIWSPLAIDRITEIADYIAQDNVDASTKWIESLYTQVERLIEFPESGRIVPEINRDDIRELIYKNYRIIYQQGKRDISILTVRHFKQILPSDEIN